MTPEQTQMLDALAPQLERKSIVTDAADIAPWLNDWRGRFHGAAPLMFAPSSVAEVSAIAQAALAFRVPLVPQGGNTSRVGGATPPPMAVPPCCRCAVSTASGRSMPKPVSR